MVAYPSKHIVVTVRNHVATIRFNNPKRYNAWGPVLMGEMMESLGVAADDPAVKAAVLTGTGDYYCSGVDFAGSFSLMKPSVFVEKLAAKNEALFEAYIAFPKPLVAAVNGPAIGACVTSAVLADRIVASPNATFHTPFHSLGIVPEGCSSVTFAERMGEPAAQRMLGAEGWKPTAEEALAVNLIHQMAPDQAALAEVAQVAAEELVASGHVPRTVADASYAAHLRQVNKDESRALAHAFLSSAFLANQEQFFGKKKKWQMAMLFKTLRLTRPLWKNI